MKIIARFHIFPLTALLCIDCLCAWLTPAAAQANRFYNKINAGILMGEDKGWSVQTIIGYQFDHLFQAGAGVGIDGYTIRSVPLFATFSASFSKRKTTPFIFTEAGAAFPWLMKKQYAFMGKRPEQNKAGPYFQVGMGQRLRMRNNKSIELSLAYSPEKLNVRYIMAQGTPPGYNYDYTFRRLSLQFGFTL